VTCRDDLRDPGRHHRHGRDDHEGGGGAQGERRGEDLRVRRTGAVGPAIQPIEKSPIDRMIVTNTIPLSDAAARCEKIKVLSVARLLGQAIKSIHEETSVSSLFV
jgi:hypothetical protein